MNAKSIRIRMGWSQAMIAVYARVSVGTIRLYEADPKAIASPEKRQAIESVYRALDFGGELQSA